MLLCYLVFGCLLLSFYRQGMNGGPVYGNALKPPIRPVVGHQRPLKGRNMEEKEEEFLIELKLYKKF